MVKLLQKCDNVAFILPYNVAVSLIKSSLNNLELGIESHFLNQIVFQLEGMWSKYVLESQALIKSESGILAMWTSLLNQTF